MQTAVRRTYTCRETKPTKSQCPKADNSIFSPATPPPPPLHAFGSPKDGARYVCACHDACRERERKRERGREGDREAGWGGAAAWKFFHPAQKYSSTLGTNQLQRQIPGLGGISGGGPEMARAMPLRPAVVPSEVSNPFGPQLATRSPACERDRLGDPGTLLQWLHGCNETEAKWNRITSLEFKIVAIKTSSDHYELLRLLLLDDSKANFLLIVFPFILFHSCIS